MSKKQQSRRRFVNDKMNGAFRAAADKSLRPCFSAGRAVKQKSALPPLSHFSIPCFRLSKYVSPWDIFSTPHKISHQTFIFLSTRDIIGIPRKLNSKLSYSRILTFGKNAGSGSAYCNLCVLNNLRGNKRAMRFSVRGPGHALFCFIWRIF